MSSLDIVPNSSSASQLAVVGLCDLDEEGLESDGNRIDMSDVLLLSMPLKKLFLRPLSAVVDFS